ncbi:hypothetical protein [Amycolatopsis vancoresmycina]|uniref:hypothetical protein n=1 Tax=Amycolatopsis vancoresmycina TaxID=208444 RepID=UPI0012DF30D0|nr:hypothetical protein [Amycolatopsis vancoresmycina]
MTAGAHRAPPLPRRRPRHLKPTDGHWWRARLMGGVLLATAAALLVGVLGELAASR